MHLTNFFCLSVDSLYNRFAFWLPALTAFNVVITAVIYEVSKNLYHSCALVADSYKHACKRHQNPQVAPMEISGCFRWASALPYMAADAVATQNPLLMSLSCFFGESYLQSGVSWKRLHIGEVWKRRQESCACLVFSG